MLVEVVEVVLSDGVVFEAVQLREQVVVVAVFCRVEGVFERFYEDFV